MMEKLTKAQILILFWLWMMPWASANNLVLVLVELSQQLPQDFTHRQFRAAFAGGNFIILGRKAPQVLQGAIAHRLPVPKQFLQIQSRKVGHLLRRMPKPVVAGGQPKLLVPALPLPQFYLPLDEELNPHILHPYRVPQHPADGVGIGGGLPVNSSGVRSSTASSSSDCSTWRADSINSLRFMVRPLRR